MSLLPVDYQPSTFFQGYFESPLGQALWAWLRSPGVCLKLSQAAEQGKPPVEGVQEGLLETFSEKVFSDPIKQFIGNMTRPIMEAQGFELDQDHIKLTSASLFVTGSTYRRASEFG